LDIRIFFVFINYVGLKRRQASHFEHELTPVLKSCLKWIWHPFTYRSTCMHSQDSSIWARTKSYLRGIGPLCMLDQKWRDRKWPEITWPEEAMIGSMFCACATGSCAISSLVGFFDRKWQSHVTERGPVRSYDFFPYFFPYFISRTFFPYLFIYIFSRNFFQKFFPRIFFTYFLTSTFPRYISLIISDIFFSYNIFSK
jgi:hypothetical protein